MVETTQTTRGIGYFETVFSAIELSTMAETLKYFALKYQVTERSKEGELLNYFVAALIKTLDLESFQALAPQFFSFPKQYEGTLEVDSIAATKEVLNYLKENIDTLLQEKTSERNRIDGKSAIDTCRS